MKKRRNGQRKILLLGYLEDTAYQSINKVTAKCIHHLLYYSFIVDNSGTRRKLMAERTKGRGEEVVK